MIHFPRHAGNKILYEHFSHLWFYTKVSVLYIKVNEWTNYLVNFRLQNIFKISSLITSISILENLA